MEKTGAAQNFQLVDFYPFLRPLYRIIPASINSFKRTLTEIKEIEDRLFFKLLDIAKENIAAGKVYPSQCREIFPCSCCVNWSLGFIRDMLLADEKDRMTEFEIANNAAHGFGAAT